MIKIGEFLTPKTKYRCPICAADLDSYDDCRTHIAAHNKPYEIIEYSAGAYQNCPMAIVVKMTDGRFANYEFKQIVEVEVPEE